ncbi:peptidoglycan recognition protein-like [Aricia agestis]|uniref:peptidoglycan recognition protein-like n=1 Tax=Aricia agestis TaxID=91739 RepID=UPI001C209FA3|nr:peptidoglycan recognition protein-like [Aricia agestis]
MNLFTFLYTFSLAWVFVYCECPHIITKDEWDGLPPTRVKYLIRPVELVIIQHAVSPTCMTDIRCEEVVRSMQNWHMEQLEYPDLAVSFVVGGNGNIYEGGGWLRAGNHTPGYDDRSIAISFMGNFNVDEPTPESLTATQALIECGVELGHLSPDYKLVGHKQLFATGSPGKKLFKEVKTWPHWTQDVSAIKNPK